MSAFQNAPFTPVALEPTELSNLLETGPTSPVLRFLALLTRRPQPSFDSPLLQEVGAPQILPETSMALPSGFTLTKATSVSAITDIPVDDWYICVANMV